MRIPVLVIAIIVGLVAAFLGYQYLNQPQPMSDRVDNTLNELGRGNIGEAADEAGNATVGDKLSDDLKDAIAPSTTAQ